MPLGNGSLVETIVARLGHVLPTGRRKENFRAALAGPLAPDEWAIPLRLKKPPHGGSGEWDCQRQWPGNESCSLLLRVAHLSRAWL